METEHCGSVFRNDFEPYVWTCSGLLVGYIISKHKPERKLWKRNKSFWQLLKIIVWNDRVSFKWLLSLAPFLLAELYLRK